METPVTDGRCCCSGSPARPPPPNRAPLRQLPLHSRRRSKDGSAATTAHMETDLATPARVLEEIGRPKGHNPLERDAVALCSTETAACAARFVYGISISTGAVNTRTVPPLYTLTPTSGARNGPLSYSTSTRPGGPEYDESCSATH